MLVLMDISQEDLDYIDKMFDVIDINQDGGISISELAKCNYLK